VSVGDVLTHSHPLNTFTGQVPRDFVSKLGRCVCWAIAHCHKDRFHKEAVPSSRVAYQVVNTHITGPQANHWSLPWPASSGTGTGSPRFSLLPLSQHKQGIKGQEFPLLCSVLIAFLSKELSPSKSYGGDANGTGKGVGKRDREEKDTSKSVYSDRCPLWQQDTFVTHSS
jgi:hypothetical protein